MFSDSEGEAAVKAARLIIEGHVRREKIKSPAFPRSFDEKSGVFVTISTFPKDDLRGCIGYPEPMLPLKDALRDSAISASSRDPRFPPVRPAELDGIRVEVSLLTPPEEITVERLTELPREVSVGDDGLIIERGWSRGLLLPQVPVEWGWDAEEFLSQTCLKAGLPPDAWLQEGVKVFKFQAEVFSEEKPRGRILRRKLSE